MAHRYSKELKSFIAENVKGTTTKGLVELVNSIFCTDFTEAKMKSYKANNKLKSGTPVGLPKGRSTDLYPQEIKSFISEHYIGAGPKAMSELLNKTFGKNYTKEQIKAYYANHSTNSGVTGQFVKGSIPPNKGKKGYHSPGCERSWFEKGNKAHNWVPIGTERVNGVGYVDIKVRDGELQRNWKGKNTVIWEAHNGPVPKGYVVIFGDGNNRNFDIGNLILVSKKQLATLNLKGLRQNDADLTRTAIIVTDLIQKISKRKKTGGEG